jgi:hypothetical protein
MVERGAGDIWILCAVLVFIYVGPLFPFFTRKECRCYLYSLLMFRCCIDNLLLCHVVYVGWARQGKVHDRKINNIKRRERERERK